MSSHRKYHLHRRSLILLNEDTIGTYRKLRDDELSTEWMKYPTSLSAVNSAPPKDTRMPLASNGIFDDSLLDRLQESSVDAPPGEPTPHSTGDHSTTSTSSACDTDSCSTPVHKHTAVQTPSQKGSLTSSSEDWNVRRSKHQKGTSSSSMSSNESSVLDKDYSGGTQGARLSYKCDDEIEASLRTHPGDCAFSDIIVIENADGPSSEETGLVRSTGDSGAGGMDTEPTGAQFSAADNVDSDPTQTSETKVAYYGPVFVKDNSFVLPSENPKKETTMEEESEKDNMPTAEANNESEGTDDQNVVETDTKMSEGQEEAAPEFRESSEMGASSSMPVYSMSPVTSTSSMTCSSEADDRGNATEHPRIHSKTCGDISVNSDEENANKMKNGTPVWNLKSMTVDTDPKKSVDRHLTKLHTGHDKKNDIVLTNNASNAPTSKSLNNIYKTSQVPERTTRQKFVSDGVLSRQSDKDNKSDHGYISSTGVSPLSSKGHSPNSSFVHRVKNKLDSAITHSQLHNSFDSGAVDSAHHVGHIVVVAIDFGTTYSGYAFSFTRDPSSIHMMKKWEGDPGVINQKTPTTILLSSDEKFHSFGFAARDYFYDLDPQEAKKWLYFEKFKMILHDNDNLSQDTQLQASNGTMVSALAIFSYSLRFFKDHALQELSDQSGIKIINEDVRWVITVPAIWRSPAKHFMRQAAYQAGLVSPEFPDQLLIALEPEAASIFCRMLKMHQLVPDAPIRRPLQSPARTTPEAMDVSLACEDVVEESHCVHPWFQTGLSPNQTLENQVQGTRYMVVDCGGGTVDITVHEMDKEGKLKELWKAVGGPHGAVGVDNEFESLLCGIFGKDFIEQFKTKRPVGWVQLMIDFESRKRSASPEKAMLNISLPFSFIHYYKKNKGSQVESAIRKYGDKEIRWSTQGMLRLTYDAMRRLFLPTLDKIKQVVGDVLNNRNVRELKYLFLVGGFAESDILKQQIRQEFGHILTIIIPQGAGLSVLKGAVMYGLNPNIINVRRSHLTYGVGVLNRFNPQKHPERKKVSKDGVEWCTDVFDKYVIIDQPVALGDCVLRSYVPATAGQKLSLINIYCTDHLIADFITDPGVRKCGTLCLDLSSFPSDAELQKREIQTRMTFGDTEIKVSALDVATGQHVMSCINFFNK